MAEEKTCDNCGHKGDCSGFKGPPNCPWEPNLWKVMTMTLDTPLDEHGKCGFTLDWVDPSGRNHGQCFRGNPDQKIKDLNERGWKVVRKGDTPKKRVTTRDIIDKRAAIEARGVSMPELTDDQLQED